MLRPIRIIPFAILFLVTSFAGIAARKQENTARAHSTRAEGLAPLAMRWQDATDTSLPSSAVCNTVTDRAKNGGLDGAALIKHHQTELVKWAWQPGLRNDGSARSVPPINYEQFMTATRNWVQA